MAESFTIEKRNGAPVIIGRPLFNEWFRKFPDETRFTVSFTRQGRKRSNQQNAYYWGVIVKSYQHGCREAWGEYRSMEQAHHDLKANCLVHERVNEATGQIIRTIGSTTENDTFDQEAYHDRCRQLIQEYFGIAVPLPGEVLEMF